MAPKKDKKAKMSELEALQQPFYVDAGSNTLSKDKVRRTRNSRVSKKAAEWSKKASGVHAPRKKWVAAAMKFSLRQPRYPRFLFRGIRPDSGGGEEMSTNLNTAEGVVPHAFMKDETYDLFNTPNLRQVVNDHINGEPTGNSPFASWTPSLAVAMTYAAEGGRVALLDTYRLEVEYNAAGKEEDKKCCMPYRVFSVPDLASAGMAHKKFNWANNPDSYEYLVFGPVRKPAYRSVAVEDILGTGWTWDALAQYGQGRMWPLGPAEESRRIREKDITVARAVAKLYRDQTDTLSEDDPAVTLNATTAFLAVPHSWRKELDESEIKLLTDLVVDDIKEWRESRKEIWPIVAPWQNTKHLPDTTLMVQMLEGCENVILPPRQQPQPQQPEPKPEAKSEPEQTGKKRKAEDDIDASNDEPTPPPSPKRQRTEEKVKPRERRPSRSYYPRKAVKTRVRTDSDPDA
ncbi:hypothetical protein PGQ11_006831 [Apiospora arundinis]|uniref:DUF7587 domain-containing protein n=1 Tax=Apiospora arundinis TaxID=335852 RepID=A0ABR2IUT0_9PEZI